MCLCVPVHYYPYPDVDVTTAYWIRIIGIVIYSTVCVFLYCDRRGDDFVRYCCYMSEKHTTWNIIWANRVRCLHHSANSSVGLLIKAAFSGVMNHESNHRAFKANAWICYIDAIYIYIYYKWRLFQITDRSLLLNWCYIFCIHRNCCETSLTVWASTLPTRVIFNIFTSPPAFVIHLLSRARICTHFILEFQWSHTQSAIIKSECRVFEWPFYVHSVTHTHFINWNKLI